MAIHPRELGARCFNPDGTPHCPMPKILEANGESFSAETIVPDCNPVPSELKATAWFAVVGESPGKEEVKLSRPFVGRSGMRLTADLGNIGIPRHSYDVINVLSCRPPNDKLDELLKRCKKQGLPSPVECCRPRLNAELRRHDKVVAAGGLAARALLKIPKGILTVRGGPVTLDRGLMEASGGVDVVEHYDPETGELVEEGIDAVASRFSAVGGAMKILPTVHPAFVLRANRWGPIFLNDLGRAVRFFQDKLNWVDPPIYVMPTAESLYKWLTSVVRPWWSWDTETEYGDPLCVDLRSFQIATSAEAVVVPFYSIEEGDFGRRFYDAVAEREIRDVLRWFLTSPAHVKFGWNCLHGDSRVTLADGSTMPINKLVRERKNVKVLAVDEKTGEIRHSRILAWHRRVDPDVRWVRLNTVRPKRSKWGSRGLVVTDDHEIILERGRVRAKDVVPGDRILFGEHRLSLDFRSALLGTVLGDSSLRVSSTVEDALVAPSAYITGSHADGAVTARKMRMLKPLLWPYPVAKGRGFGKESISYPFRSVTLRQLVEFWPLLFDAPRVRRIRVEALDQLGPIGLAWWFMDDGNFFAHHGKDTVELALCRYPEDDREMIKQWLIARYGGTRAWVSARGVLAMSADMAALFAAEIAPHVFPECRYKLPRAFRDALRDDWYPVAFQLDDRAWTEEIGEVEVDYAVKGTRSERRVRWCITTETGNFFTPTGLVSNSGSFDRQVAEHHFGVTPKPSVDGILIHRLVNPEIPHSLGVVGSIYTDVTAWKNDADGNAISSNARTNDQLWKYGGTDAVVTDQIAPQILDAAAKRANEVAAAFGYPREAQLGLDTKCPGVPGWTLSQVDHFRQEMCVGIHKVGMYVDQAERIRLIEKYEGEVAVLEGEIRELARSLGAKHFDPSAVDDSSFGSKSSTLFGVSSLTDVDDTDTSESEEAARDAARENDDLNPGSADQLRELLYDDLGLIPIDTTESGLPSTSSECILGHIIDPTLPLPLIVFLEKIRRFRRIKNKYLGTYLKPFGIMDEDGSGKRDVKGYTKKGRETVKRVTAHCWRDGRARATANAHVANVGRLSLSKPGMQQIPQKMRSIFVPAPGHVFVEADYDQLHLRIIASRWRVKRLLDSFLYTGEDPHLMLGVDLFGELLTKAEGWIDVRTKPKANTSAGRIRDNNKTLRYAAAYWAMVATIHATMLKAEDRDGNLVNCGSKVPPEKRLTERDVAAMYQVFMDVEPEWQQAWRTELAYYLKFGFVADPILGRRNDFADIVRAEFRADEDKERSAIVNYPILAGEVGVAVLGEIDIMEALPYSDACDRSGWGSKQFGPGTGLVMQSHDAELLEVPADKADWACDLLRRSMNRKVPGFEVPFTSAPDVKTRWKDA